MTYTLDTFIKDAKTALDRLKSGESWTDVAKDLSGDSASKDSAGDLGYLPRGVKDEDFCEKANERNSIKDLSHFAQLRNDASIPYQHDQHELKQILKPNAEILHHRLLQLRPCFARSPFNRRNIVLRNAEVVGQLALG